MKIILTAVIAIATLSAAAATRSDAPAKQATAPAPAEIWLTPERRAMLSAITSRPRIVSKDLAGDTEILRWSNGAREWTTTQTVHTVLGKKATSPKQALLDDLKRIKDKPTKQNVKAVIDKHSNGKATKK